jgi:mannose-6-phosphate isomerase-like protein (cupin superfamily)
MPDPMHLRPQDLLARLPLPATDRWPEGVRFVEAFAKDGLEMELYAPRGVDHQSPHAQDEIYIVVAGSATLDIDGIGYACAIGDALFVPARVPHHFANISDDFATWAIFWGEAIP